MGKINNSPSFENGLRYGVRLLARRDYTVAQIRSKLQQRLYPTALIDTIIERLANYGYLDDTRYTTLFIQAQQRKGQGKRAIAAKLAQKGIDRELIETHLTQTSDEGALDRFLQSYQNVDLSDRKQRERLVRAAMRRGFSLHNVLGKLRDGDAIS